MNSQVAVIIYASKLNEMGTVWVDSVAKDRFTDPEQCTLNNHAEVIFQGKPYDVHVYSLHRSPSDGDKEAQRLIDSFKELGSKGISVGVCGGCYLSSQQSVNSAAGTVKKVTSKEVCERNNTTTGQGLVSNRSLAVQLQAHRTTSRLQNEALRREIMQLERETTEQLGGLERSVNGIRSTLDSLMGIVARRSEKRPRALSQDVAVHYFDDEARSNRDLASPPPQQDSPTEKRSYLNQNNSDLSDTARMIVNTNDLLSCESPCISSIRLGDDSTMGAPCFIPGSPENERISTSSQMSGVTYSTPNSPGPSSASAVGENLLATPTFRKDGHLRSVHSCDNLCFTTSETAPKPKGGDDVYVIGGNSMGAACYSVSRSYYNTNIIEKVIKAALGKEEKPKRLTQELLKLLFSSSELAGSCATGTPRKYGEVIQRKLPLCHRRLSALAKEVNLHFPEISCRCSPRKINKQLKSWINTACRSRLTSKKIKQLRDKHT